MLFGFFFGSLKSGPSAAFLSTGTPQRFLANSNWPPSSPSMVNSHFSASQASSLTLEAVGIVKFRSLWKQPSRFEPFGIGATSQFTSALIEVSKAVSRQTIASRFEL